MIKRFISRHSPYWLKDLATKIKNRKAFKEQTQEFKLVDDMIKIEKEEDNYLYIYLPEQDLHYCGKKEKFPKEFKSVDYSSYKNITPYLLENYYGLFCVLRSVFIDKIYPIENKGIFIDCGAHIGIVSILAAKKSSKVISIEPDKENVEVLKRNIKLNNLKNVIVINKALGDTQGKTQFFVTKAGSQSGSIIPQYAGHRISEVEEVEVDLLDSILLGLGIELNDIRTIKMDIEGAEYQALKGAKYLLRYFDNIQILLSTHTIEGENLDKLCLPLLKQWGYVVTHKPNYEGYHLRKEKT